MKGYAHLPEGYKLKKRVDLVKNRKHLRSVTIISLILAVCALLAGFYIAPEQPPFDWFMLFQQVLLGVSGLIVYIAGHEAVHGALMWLISRKKPRFGFKLIYAYAASSAYFDKTSYLLIAVAPIMLWTAFLTGMALEQSAVFFWPIWAVQIMNWRGSAGDVYMLAQVLAVPGDVLVHDDGASMTFWCPAD